jgi:hypothetical protein
MKPEEEKQKALWRQEKFRAFREELQKNEVMQKFLEDAYPNSKEGFISEYAHAKVRWIEYGPKHVEWNERDDLQWYHDAMARIGEIQQKKLFDMQCQWRAEKIEIPEIKITRDFYYWEEYILDCPFIPPATEDDIGLYIQYLHSSNFEKKQGWLDRWQDYDEIKEAYQSENANRNFPEWYDFHNGRTGASAYMLLPDIRGEKEEFYLDFWRKELHKKSEEQRKETEAVKSIAEAAGISLNNPLPHLGFHKRGWLTWFVTTYEDKETQKAFEQYGGESIYHSDNDESVDNDLDTLRDSETPVAIEGWYDWKEAIHRAAHKYSTEKIIEALPLAYEKYRMNIELKIPFLELKPDEDVWYRNAILRGRELNGEPKDFDF